jgi:beta-glucanase (GH16 family)
VPSVHNVNLSGVRYLRLFVLAADDDVVRLMEFEVWGTTSTATWVITFDDEFTGAAGSAPDTSKWNRLAYQRRPGGAWVASDATLDGSGHLDIAVKYDSPGQYEVGAISTNDAVGPSGAKFSQTYGKFEASCQWPTKQGWWVSFWMMSGNQGQVGNGSLDGAEVDIFEGFGLNTKQNFTVIWDGYGAQKGSAGTSANIANIKTGYHTSTLVWDPDMYYFYIDGVEYFRTAGGGSPCNQPGIINLTGELSTEAWAVSTSWAGDPAAATYPDHFYTDWVHVYRRGP